MPSSTAPQALSLVRRCPLRGELALRKITAGGRWVAPIDASLTLAFVGGAVCRRTRTRRSHDLQV